MARATLQAVAKLADVSMTRVSHVITYIFNRRDPYVQFVSELLLGLTDRALFDEYHVVILPEAEISPLGCVEYLSKRSSSRAQLDLERILIHGATDVGF